LVILRDSSIVLTKPSLSKISLPLTLKISRIYSMYILLSRLNSTFYFYSFSLSISSLAYSCIQMVIRSCSSRPSLVTQKLRTVAAC
jgi:hypothetical protein